MRDFIKGFGPVEEDDGEAALGAFTYVQEAADEVDGLSGTAVRAEAVLCGCEVGVEDRFDSEVESRAEDFVNDVEERNGSVVVEVTGWSLFVDLELNESQPS